MELDISRALESLVKALARKGDLSAAIALARESNEPAQRLKLIEALSAVHAQSGYKLITVRWARTLSSPSERAFALVGIATGLSQEADKRKTKAAVSHHLGDRRNSPVAPRGFTAVHFPSDELLFIDWQRRGL